MKKGLESYWPDGVGVYKIPALLSCFLLAFSFWLMISFASNENGLGLAWLGASKSPVGVAGWSFK